MNEVKWSLKNLRTDEVIEVSKPIFKVGRQLQADITTELREISRNHATLSILIGGLLYVHDNKSCNGTFINNEKIEPMENILLGHGDVVVFGMNQHTAEEWAANSPPLIFKVSKISRSEGIVQDNAQYSINVEDGIIDEDCIVISDEEDEPFAQSQIFNISKKIKKEQTSYRESIDPYFEIKQELHDLECDGENNIPVDLTDDVDHFESTTDLLNILEPESSGMSLTTCTVSCNTGKLAEKKPADEQLEPPKQVDSKSARTLRSRQSDEKKAEKSSKQTKSRAVQVISPTEAERSRAERAKKESSSKRKSSKVDSEPNKKLKTSKQDKPSNAKVSPPKILPITPKEKRDIAAERRKRLREIAIKKKGESKDAEKYSQVRVLESYEEPSTSRRYARGKVAENFPEPSNKRCPKIKFSDLNDIPSKSTEGRRDPRQRKNSSDKSGRRVQEKRVQKTNKTGHDDIQDTTISSNFSPKSDSNQNIRRNHIVPASNAHVSYLRPDSTVNEDRNAEELTEEIHKILRWSVKWLVEQNSIDISPPVYGEQRVVPVPQHFETFSNYKDVMSPLIMLELWQLIFQTAYSKEDERNPVTAVIKHLRQAEPICCLDCETNSSEKDDNMFRQEELCLIELRVRAANNNSYQYQYTSYGYIKYVKRIPSRSGFLTKFSILTKNFNMPTYMDKILVKVIGSVGGAFRLFKTIKYLSNSPLCQYVLKPNKIEHRIDTNKNLMPEKGNLNPQQLEIVTEASAVCMGNSPGIYLIKGPPGTGKSFVIANIILNVLNKSLSMNKPALILLTAPSNAAVDGLILKLMELKFKLPEFERKNLKLVRIGPDSSISPSVNKFKLSALAQNHILTSKELMNEYLKPNRTNAEAFLREKLGQRYQYEFNTTEDLLLFRANVICTTLNSCVGFKIAQGVRWDKLKFTCCIIDEATQCNEVESLMPIQLGIDKFVLVGDPKQLPAVVCNKEAQKMGYGTSLFARIDENFSTNRSSPIKMLMNQYRMRPEICEYPNKTFYEGKLKSRPTFNNPIEPAIKPYLVFNVNRNEGDSSDYVNSDEVHLIRNLLETLRKCVKPTCQYTIGIITPYKAQKELISRDISNIRMPPSVSVTVNTVDSFQGLENDVIIISCVRYTANYFLQNEQRLNVALTRARQALYVIGNYALFKNCRPLYDLRENAKKRKCLLDIKDNPRNIPTFHKYIMKK
ncbi:hypothetical protein JTB14_017988 [Gonioctena quinquepunctata]|nr:hypothetical protein JTB14_017988 [Gonioctena quinquepunctata]